MADTPCTPGPTLDELVGGHREAFFRDTWHRTFQRFEGPADRFDGFFGWEDLNHILAHAPLDGIYIRVTRNGRDLPRSAYLESRSMSTRSSADGAFRLVAPHRLAGCLRDGATLVVNRVSQLHPRVERFTRRLERELGSPVNANLYAGWRTDHGFAKHWDGHDFFILQVAGRKRWVVYPDTRPHPIEGDTALERVPTRPLWEGMLAQGDVLYVPRGFWHVAYPVDEPSMHLTVGIGKCTGDTVLSWLRSRLMASRHFRSDVPLLEGSEAVAAYLRTLLDEIGREAACPDGFLSWWDGRADRTGQVGLPAVPTVSGAPGPPVRLELSVARRLRVREVAGVDRIEFRALGHTHRLPSAAGPLVEALGAGFQGTVDELAALCGDPLAAAERRRLLDDLFRRGILAVVPAFPAS